MTQICSTLVLYIQHQWLLHVLPVHGKVDEYRYNIGCASLSNMTGTNA